jgi:hypothetical protein
MTHLPSHHVEATLGSVPVTPGSLAPPPESGSSELHSNAENQHTLVVLGGKTCR